MLPAGLVPANLARGLLLGVPALPRGSGWVLQAFGHNKNLIGSNNSGKAAGVDAGPGHRCRTVGLSGEHKERPGVAGSAVGRARPGEGRDRQGQPDPGWDQPADGSGSLRQGSPC